MKMVALRLFFVGHGASHCAPDAFPGAVLVLFSSGTSKDAPVVRCISATHLCWSWSLAICARRQPEVLRADMC